MLSVKGAGIGGIIAVVRILADGCPFLSGLAAGAGGVAAVLGKGTIVENDVVHQHSPRATVLRLATRTIDNIPEQLQLVGGANLIGVCLRAAAGHRGVKCAAFDDTAAGDCVVKDAAGDGSVVGHLTVECAAFDGAAGGNGHFAIEHSPAGACNGTGTVFCISQHDVAVNRAVVGIKNPIARLLRAGDV